MAQPLEVSREVIDEAVVVVDQEDHQDCLALFGTPGPRPPAKSAAGSRWHPFSCVIAYYMAIVGTRVVQFETYYANWVGADNYILPIATLDFALPAQTSTPIINEWH